MPIADKKPDWWQRLEALWREATPKGQHRHVKRGSEANVVPAREFLAQLQVLHRKTLNPRFRLAAESIRNLQLIDDQGRWKRSWRRPIDDLAENGLAVGVHQELQRLRRVNPLFLGRNEWAGRLVQWYQDELEGRTDDPVSVTRACAEIAVSAGIAASSFQEAIDRIREIYLRHKEAVENDSRDFAKNALQEAKRAAAVKQARERYIDHRNAGRKELAAEAFEEMKKAGMAPPNTKPTTT